MLIDTDDEKEDCSPMRTKMVAYNTLPEVQQYVGTMHDIYKDFCFVKMKGKPRMIRDLFLPGQN
jgi:hypothetical protein